MDRRELAKWAGVSFEPSNGYLHPRRASKVANLVGTGVNLRALNSRVVNCKLLSDSTSFNNPLCSDLSLANRQEQAKGTKIRTARPQWAGASFKPSNGHLHGVHPKVQPCGHRPDFRALISRVRGLSSPNQLLNQQASTTPPCSDLSLANRQEPASRGQDGSAGAREMHEDAHGQIAVGRCIFRT